MGSLGTGVSWGSLGPGVSWGSLGPGVSWVPGVSWGRVNHGSKRMLGASDLTFSLHSSSSSSFIFKTSIFPQSFHAQLGFDVPLHSSPGISPAADGL